MIHGLIPFDRRVTAQLDLPILAFLLNPLLREKTRC
jgi:hypothetical protein